MIYVIGTDDGAGLVKIGWAGDVGRRLKALQAGSPVRLAVLAVADGPRRSETMLHHKCATARAHGEWFRREPCVEAVIGDIRAAVVEVSMRVRPSQPRGKPPDTAPTRRQALCRLTFRQRSEMREARRADRAEILARHARERAAIIERFAALVSS